MDIINTVWQYIYKYYINGIIYDTSYNIVDTLTYAILLGISLFGVLKLLEKLDVDIDTRFMIAVTPYILAGSSLRVLEDSKAFTPPLEYLFITPIIYFFMFAVTVSFLVLAIILERKGKIKDYHAFFGYAGLVWTAINIAALLAVDKITNPVPASAILILGIIATGIVYLVSRQFKFTLLTDKLNISILFTHLLDASSTFIGIDWLGYYEKHVAPTFFIDMAGNYMAHPSLVMYPLKLLVFIPVLYMLDYKFDAQKEKKLIAMMKLAILVLGLSPAVRNTLRILMGV
ncbi:MAG: DUF63 family protein [Candidatus Methanoperedens sp.]|nr:DUF63 family protein [Candidatus Methanoperedens sp.]